MVADMLKPCNIYWASFVFVFDYTRQRIVLCSLLYFFLGAQSKNHFVHTSEFFICISSCVERNEALSLQKLFAYLLGFAPNSPVEIRQNTLKPGKNLQ